MCDLSTIFEEGSDDPSTRLCLTRVPYFRKVIYSFWLIILLYNAVLEEGLVDPSIFSMSFKIPSRRMCYVSTIFRKGLIETSSRIFLNWVPYLRKGWPIFPLDDAWHEVHIWGSFDRSFYLIIHLYNTILGKFGRPFNFSGSLRIPSARMCDWSSIFEEGSVDPSCRWCSTWDPYLRKGQPIFCLNDAWKEVHIWGMVSWSFIYSMRDLKSIFKECSIGPSTFSF